VHVATERYQTLKRNYDSVLDSIRIKHRASLRKIQIVHAQQIQKKNEMVKRMWNDAEGTHEMLCVMLDEMNESRRTVKFASSSADKAMTLSKKATKRASILFKKLQTSTSLINELKDEINDKTRTIDDLKKKVGEYDEVIDWMEHEYEERCQEYET
jgi:methyl-accepting chemotaxis protein